MNAILTIFQIRVLRFWRNKAAVVITFVVPIVLIAIMGSVFGLYKTKSTASGIRLAVVNLSTDPAATELVGYLKTEKALQVLDRTPDNSRVLTEADVRAAIHDNQYHFAVIIPPDFVPTDDIGLRLKFLSDPRNEIETQIVNGLLQKTVFSNLLKLLSPSLKSRAIELIGQEKYAQFNHSIADLISRNFGGDPDKIYTNLSEGKIDLEHKRPAADHSGLRPLDTAPASTSPATPSKAETSADDSSGNLLQRVVKLDTEQVVGKDVSNPMAARTVGGYAIMFLLFAVSSSASTLFEEKQTGIFERILSTPVRPAHILWGRFLYGVVLGLVQNVVLFVAGDFLFGLDLTHHIGGLLAVATAGAAACTAFGMLLAAVAPTAEAANGLATLLVLTMSSIGGAWFPVSIMPDFMQKLSHLTIVYWAVEGFAAVLWAGKSLVEVLPYVGVLTGITIVVMAIATWRFKAGRMFT